MRTELRVTVQARPSTELVDGERLLAQRDPNGGKLSFDDEWAQLKANAQAEQATGTRLNGTGGGSGGKGKLHVTPSLLRGRANKAENEASKEFKDAHKDVLAKTAEIPGSMKGFSSAGAFSDFVDSWEKGAKYVAGQIGKEGLGGALRSAADSFETEDHERKRSFEKKYTYKPGDVI